MKVRELLDYLKDKDPEMEFCIETEIHGEECYCDFAGILCPRGPKEVGFDEIRIVTKRNNQANITQTYEDRSDGHTM